MFAPEYLITPKILNNIGTIEYAKAIFDTTPILSSYENQLKKENLIKLINSECLINGINFGQESVKKYLDNLTVEVPQEALNIHAGYQLVNDISKSRNIEEIDIKYIHKTISNNLISKTKQGIYRTVKYPEKPEPEEILAKMTEIFDWYNRVESKENHPVITATILRGTFEVTQTFGDYNDLTGDFVMLLALKIAGYDFKEFLSLPTYFHKTHNEYQKYLSTLIGNDPDYTFWIEYVTEGLAAEAINLKEKIILLERDTKMSKISGVAGLTERQERIIEYLQDYGLIQNKHFQKIFPDVSEDSILRDLKVLIDRKIVEKTGSTKSSRYELR